MSRVALLPTRGDPVFLLLFLHSYKNIWCNEVDKMIINVNSPIEKEVIDFIKEESESLPNVTFIHDPITTSYHGGSLTCMFNKCEEDIVFFVEDDSYILYPGTVDRYAQMIEQEKYDAVGTIRWMCTDGIVDAVKNKFPNAKGNFWPCHFLARRSDLLKTDLNFSGVAWKAGDYVKELDWSVKKDECGDTFVWMSMQLRALGLNILEMPSFDGGTVDDMNYHKKLGIFYPGCPWIHHRSVSLEVTLLDNKNIPLIRRKVPGAVSRELSYNPEMDKKNAEQIIGWACLALNVFEKKLDKIKDFKEAYIDSLNRVINKWELNKEHINLLASYYKERCCL